MIPTSEELEAYQERVAKTLAALGIDRNFTSVASAARLGDLAREWFPMSAALKEGTDGFLPALEIFDMGMAEVLKLSKQRTRSNSYRQQLQPFKTKFLDDVVVPLMRHEGSPSQSAARQLEAVFEGIVSQEEALYINEAARCSASRCNRAAIVMLWAAAIARLHAGAQYVGFAAYNAAIAESTQKKAHPYSRVQNTNVASLGDLQLRSDFDILVVGMTLWKYDSQTFNELSSCLNTRNLAAHPGSFDPTSLDVRQFANKLKQYVFETIAKP